MTPAKPQSPLLFDKHFPVTETSPQTGPFAEHDYLAIGLDEAGYGPNLGPLVIGLTAWHVSSGHQSRDLYELAAPHISASRPKASEPCLWIADSKAVYQTGKGIADLETEVLALLHHLGKRPTTFAELYNNLQCDEARQRNILPWHNDESRPTPLVAAPDGFAQKFAAFRSLKTISLQAIRARCVFPQEFNLGVAALGSKGAVLTQAALQLLAHSLANISDERISVVIDKHGGRNQYSAPLAAAWSHAKLTVLQESRASSIYLLEFPQRQMQVEFRAKGESSLPTAAASMTAKYLRETSMHAFNAFWTGLQPGLRPTAGYPVDAKRFWEESAKVRAKLGLADEFIWRCR